MEFNPDGSLKLTKVQEDVLKKQEEIRKRDDKKREQLKNTFFRESIYALFQNSCKLCRATENLEIHHTRYNSYCPYFERNLKPDCRKCRETDYKTFIRCIACCELLCRSCHQKSHKILLRSTGDWTGYAKAGPLPRAGECKYCNFAVDDEVIYCPNCQRKIRATEQDNQKFMDELKNIDEKYNELLFKHLGEAFSKLTGDKESDEKLMQDASYKFESEFSEHLHGTSRK